MAQQPGRSLPNDNPVFKRPVNLDVIQDAMVLPSERVLLSSHANISLAKYAVCMEEDNLTGMLPEEKDFTVQFFGDLKDLRVGGDGAWQPIAFDDFIRQIRFERGVATASQLTVWATPDLNTPAERIAGPLSNAQFHEVLFNHEDIFRKDPLNHVILYFFVEFDRRSGTIPSSSSLEYIAQPFLLDQIDPYVAGGGVSPRHIPVSPTGHDSSRNDVTAPNDAPVAPPVQSKRTNTFETGKKAVSKLTIAVKNAAETVKDFASPREAPEQPTVLTELASGVEEKDYLSGLLEKTNRSLESQADINTYQVQLFERYARLFPHIDSKQRANTRSIRFRGTALAVTPHQFTRACQILFQDHTTGGLAGGFLASEMGSGKSYVILTSVSVRALMYQSRRRVLREWEDEETRASLPRKGSSSRRAKKLEHLPRDAPRGQGLRCPTEAHRGLDAVCFCVPDGATRNMIPALKSGAALIHVPSASMPGWISTLDDANFSRTAYNFTVLYSGPPLSSRLQPNPDFLKGSRLSSWKMGAALPEGHPGGLVTDTRELTWFVQPAPVSDRLNMAMETYIVVTSHNSLMLRDLYKWSTKDLSPAPQNCQFPPEGLYAYPIGLTFIDESHKVLQENSIPLEMARVHRHIHPTTSTTGVADVWLVSGTPFGAQLKDLAAAVSFLAPDRAEDAKALLTAYEAIKHAMTNTPKAMFEALFDRVFGGQLVIKDDGDSTFMGSRVTAIQKVRPQYISRSTPESQLHSVRMIIDTKVSKGANDAYFDTLVKLKQNTELLYLLSMFPSAARILLDTPDTPFTDLDVRRTIRKEKNTTGESLQAHKVLRPLAEKLAQSPRSPKFQYILDELERMAKDVTPRQQDARTGASAHIQNDQTLKKLVIITPTLFTAVMLYLILVRYHARSGPLLYHEDLKQSQRSDVLRRFNSLRKRDGPWRCFIAPASVASEALSLQIANRLILTSPLLNIHQEKQALARVNRAGQTLDVELKVLLLEDSPLDRIVVAHRASAKFQSDPFNVDESVSVVTSE